MESTGPANGNLAERVSEIRYALMRELPFFGHLLLNIPLRFDARGSLVVTNVGPLGVLHLDPVFAESLSRGELATVLLHGVLHLAFGCFHRRGERDPDLWNQAHDFAINLVIEEVRRDNPRMGLAWPPQKFLSPKWLGLTAEAVYDRLVQERRLTDPSGASRQRPDGPKDQPDSQGDSVAKALNPSPPTHENSTKAGGAIQAPVREHNRAVGEGLDQAGRRGDQGPIRPRAAGKGFQDATDCVRVRQEGASRDAEALAAGLQERALRNLLAEAMAIQQARNAGVLPGSIPEWVDLALRPPVPWVEPFLQRVQGRLQGGGLSYARPSRRSLALGDEGVVLPGRTRRLPRVAVILDTSGSMDAADLGEFLATVRQITETLSAEIRLIQVDAAIQSDQLVDDFELAIGQSFPLLGRGGTIFDDLPERLQDEAFEPVDLAILFTDGMPMAWPPAEAWTTDLLVVTTSDLPPVGYEAIRFSPT